MSRPVRELLDSVARYAAITHPLLILGEPGTGKTVLARHIHTLSGRAGAFVKESAAAIPTNLEQSHLAGHLRGSFTGAFEHRAGLFESAHMGTFFLDELGVASAKVQEILLQLMDDGTLRRVGETRTRPVSVRIIAATNAGLDTMVTEGSFRRDLRDRFGYIVLRLPRLVDRRDEIIPLAEHFVEVEAAAMHRPPPRLGKEVIDCLMASRWPGNIRELRSLCCYAVVSAPAGSTLTVNHLPPDFLATLGTILRRRADRTAAAARDALARADGNKSRAARLLGVSRQHFYRLLAGGDS